MSYRQVLDEAIGDSPVSTVDVDAVITRQRRAAKLRRWGACGAGAAAVLAVIVTAVQVLPGRALTETADGPQITTVAGTREDVTRLDDAVLAAVQREVPGLRWGDPAWGHDGGDKSTLVRYEGQGEVMVGGAKARLILSVDRFGARHFDAWGCPPSLLICRDSTGPRGERVRTQVPAGSGVQPSPSPAQAVRVARPGDDALVEATLAYPGAPNAIPPVTLQQLTAIALDPALALAPVPPGVVVTPPEPVSSESPVQSAEHQRITDAVFASLRKQGPGVQVPANWILSPAENTADSYFGQGTLVVNGVSGLFMVQMSRTDTGLSGDLKCGTATKAYTCKAGKGPHGERYRTVTTTDPSGGAMRDVAVLRKDGSWLLVTLNANPPAGKFGLTAAKQQAIAFDQAIGWKPR
jgi:hypothetical protein